MGRYLAARREEGKNKKEGRANGGREIHGYREGRGKKGVGGGGEKRAVNP